uniref:Uncharacterized protein n=1 Tax=Phakopsora pachyrhizi TaxID=170000 RepID=A0A0S1MIF9_PHAPC
MLIAIILHALGSLGCIFSHKTQRLITGIPSLSTAHLVKQQYELNKL